LNRATWVRAALTLLLIAHTWPALAVGEPIVLGQSIAEGRGSYRGTLSLVGGLRAYVGHINATGGVQGRPIKVVTLVGDNDALSHAANVRTLVREHGAVAIVGCAGDGVCQAIAKAAAELHVPLIGALSGLKAMGHDRSPYLFPLRPNYEREAEALAMQISTLGITRAALLSDSGADSERAVALLRALQAKGIGQTLYAVSLTDTASIGRALNGIAKGEFQTVVMDVLPDMVDALAEQGLKARSDEWPSTITSLASSAFQGIGNIFPKKVLGFTQLVPNPEADNSPLSFEFLRHAEQYASPKAITFDGMSNYMAAKLTVEALRRAHPRITGANIAAELSAASTIDLGGHSVSFARGRSVGSDRVTLGLRSRDGNYLK
jgi:branched-chain amino acid transport system substrate-binding protein